MQVPSCPPHWWQLPVSDGPVSVGVCRFCDATREFANSPEGNSFKVAGTVALAKKKRKDHGDFYAGGDKVTGTSMR